MTIRAFIFSIACLTSLSTFPQQTTALDGDWIATFNRRTYAGSRAITVKVYVQGETGTFQGLDSDSTAPCNPLEKPLSISNLQPNSFDMTVFGSKALKGCPDLKIHFERIDERTFQGRDPAGGQNGTGRSYRLVRP